MRILSLLLSLVLAAPALAQPAYQPGPGPVPAGASTVTATGGTTAIPLGAWFQPAFDVRTFGAAMNGTTDDSAAFNAARTASGNNGTVFVPPGGFNITIAPTGGSSSPILWRLSGNSYGTGSTIVNGLGTDTVETTLSGAKFYARSNTIPNAAPVVRVDGVVNNTGGTAGFVVPSLQVNTTINAVATNDYAWGISSTLNSSATGPGQHVAVAGYANRAANGSEIWGGNFSAADKTGNKSSLSGALVGTEIDLTANDIDDGGAAGSAGGASIPSGQGIRVAEDIVGSTYGAGTAATLGWGSRVGGVGVVFRRGYAMNGSFNIAGFTTEYATESAGSAYKMAAGQHLSFDATDTHRWAYVPGTSSMQYQIGAASVFQIDDSVAYGGKYFDFAYNSGFNRLTLSGQGGNNFAIDASGGGAVGIAPSGSLTQVGGALTIAGTTTFSASAILTQSTVAALPACVAGLKGALYGVTDAVAPTYNGALTGGGTVAIPVYCNGSAWTAH